MDIVIVGAGIGGLTAAASLLQRGHRVRVVEQSQALGEIGAGLQLSANAVKVLFSLGLKEALDVDGVNPIWRRVQQWPSKTPPFWRVLSISTCP